LTYAVGGEGGDNAGNGATGNGVYGNGGGAAGDNPANGSGGTDGVVIISYPTNGSTGIDAALTTGGTITTSGGNTIHTFASSGTFTVVLLSFPFSPFPSHYNS
jgi:hypothetical protein